MLVLGLALQHVMCNTSQLFEHETSFQSAGMLPLLAIEHAAQRYASCTQQLWRWTCTNPTVTYRMHALHLGPACRCCTTPSCCNRVCAEAHRPDCARKVLTHHSTIKLKIRTWAQTLLDPDEGQRRIGAELRLAASEDG